MERSFSILAPFADRSSLATPDSGQTAKVRLTYMTFYTGFGIGNIVPNFSWSRMVPWFDFALRGERL